MKQIDELLYDAICADADLIQYIGGEQQVQSTCFEVSPDEQDNTPIPYLIVTFDGFQLSQGTKDAVWESDEDSVSASVEIAAESPREVHKLTRMVRRAIENHMCQLYTEGKRIPQLNSLRSDGIAWDWLKPCYYTHLTYQVTTNNDDDDEQTS